MTPGSTRCLDLAGQLADAAFAVLANGVVEHPVGRRRIAGRPRAATHHVVYDEPIA